jgi:hypothetical protein
MTHSCELEDFGGQVFEDGGNVDGSLGPNAHLILGVVLQETLDTTAGELTKKVSLADVLNQRLRIERNVEKRKSSRSRSADANLLG